MHVPGKHNTVLVEVLVASIKVNTGLSNIQIQGTYNTSFTLFVNIVILTV